MNFQKAAAMAEIISSVAIVVTLVYLSVQTQQNTKALLAVSRQAALQAELDIASDLVEYPEANARAKEERSPVDEARSQAIVLKVLRVREFEWLQYKSGILDEASWRSYMAPMRSLFANRRARDVLKLYTGDPEFKAYLNNWLDKGADP